MLVPHGHYLDFIKPKTNKIVEKKKFGLQNKKVIMFFGMIKEEKGLDILIKSFHEVYQNNKVKPLKKPLKYLNTLSIININFD